MDKWQKHYDKLNNKQREAVDYIDGPLLVVAGPGSGKTELLALRIANILRETQTAPESILCLTFTDSGAVNMRERLTKIIGSTARKVAIHTFHSFARRIMDENREYFYNAFEFDIATDIDKEEILDMAFRNLPHSSTLAAYHNKLGWAYYRDVKNRIRDIKMAGYNSHEYEILVNKSEEELEIVNKIFNYHWTTDRMSIKNILWLDNLIEALEINNNLTATAYKKELEHLKDEASEAGKTSPISDWASSNIVKEKKNTTSTKNKTMSSELENDISLKEYENLNKTKDIANIYKYYEENLNERGLYDYDDMIINVKSALYENIDLHNNIAEKYIYIMIDEFQDTNEAQMRLINGILSVNTENPNIFAVGDDDQSIYKFQ